MISNIQLFFLITVLAIDVPLLLAASIREKLPTKANGILRSLLLVEFVIVLFQYPLTLPIASLLPVISYYTIASVYFCLFGMRSFLFFMYVRYLMLISLETTYNRTLVYKVPIYIYLSVVLTTPFTGALYSYSLETGYQEGPLHILIYLVSLFYVLLTYVLVIRKRKELSVLTRRGLFASNTLVFLAVMLRPAYRDTCLVSFIMVLAILVLYLYVSNPYFFLIPEMDIFGRRAFRSVVRDGGNVPGKRDCLFIHIDNYRAMRHVYDNANLSEVKITIANFLKKCHFKRIYYLDNGNFMLVYHINENAVDTETIRGRFEVPWKLSFGYITISASFMFVPAGKKYIDYTKLDKYAEFVFSDLYHDKGALNLTLTEDIARKANFDLKVEELLKYAVEHNNLEVFFQPIVSAQTEKVVSLEALARLHDEELGYINPEYFINTAEKMGIIDELGNQIMSNACKIAQDNRFDLYGVRRLEVNISPIQCIRKDFIESIEIECKNFRNDRIKLNFEITESCSLNMEKLERDMKYLIAQGYTFSLDDYGTGYSNFINIKSLPFSIIKIDKALVWSHFEEGENSTTLPNLVQLIKDMDKEVIAEGVESAEMVQGLADMGVDYLQGFYCGEPMSCVDLLEYLKEHHGDAVADKLGLHEGKQ